MKSRNVKLPKHPAIMGRNAKMKKQIIMAIFDALTVKEAIAAIHTLEQTSEKLREFINRPHIQGDIAGLLVAKFGSSGEE